MKCLHPSANSIAVRRGIIVFSGIIGRICKEKIVVPPKTLVETVSWEVQGQSYPMQPKVSIILPVYNVEPYLRQCLDSVVNQTMQEIQIICVNDGSTDGSPAILEEYAAKDTRIEVVHQENQGGGSARNAAYPYIRGKYTYFVDPDDWIDLDLCQQCWDKAEETEADIVALRHVEHNPERVHTIPFDNMLPTVRQAPKERYEILRWSSPWKRFWRTDFLLSNDIRFSEGKRPCNDLLASWKGTVLANGIAVLDNPLYHYRVRPGSYQQSTGEKHFIIVETYNDVGTMLHDTGLYESYRDIYLAVKIQAYYSSYRYRRFSSSQRSRFFEHIRRFRTNDEYEFARTAPKDLVPQIVRSFYKMIDGGILARMSYCIALTVYIVAKTVKMPKRRLFQKIVQRIKSKLGCRTKNLSTD